MTLQPISLSSSQTISQPTLPDPVLSVNKLTKTYANTDTAAVCDVSLTLQTGQILGLLGPSGCGKTTLLRMIAGFERPDAGEICLAGQPVAGIGQGRNSWVPPERRDVGMVFQDYALFPHLTVAQNVAFGLRHRRWLRRFSPKQVQQLSHEALALVRLTGYEQRFPHELSGGQQQRVALARALAPQPAILLLDEPLSNLDVHVRLHLREEVREILKQTQTTALFVTHDQEEALAVSDLVAVMAQGRLEQLGTPEAIYQQPASRFVAEFVTQSNFLSAQRQGQGWLTEVGYFEAESAINSAIVPAAEQVALMIRPENLLLEPDDSGSVVIRDRHFLGREHRYCLLAPSGQELHAHLATDATPIPVGSRVKLSAATGGVQVFAA